MMMTMKTMITMNLIKIMVENKEIAIATTKIMTKVVKVNLSKKMVIVKLNLLLYQKTFALENKARE